MQKKCRDFFSFLFLYSKFKCPLKKVVNVSSTFRFFHWVSVKVLALGKCRSVCFNSFCARRSQERGSAGSSEARVRPPALFSCSSSFSFLWSQIQTSGKSRLPIHYLSEHAWVKKTKKNGFSWWKMAHWVNAVNPLKSGFKFGRSEEILVALKPTLQNWYTIQNNC